MLIVSTTLSVVHPGKQPGLTKAGSRVTSRQPRVDLGPGLEAQSSKTDDYKFSMDKKCSQLVCLKIISGPEHCAYKGCWRWPWYLSHASLPT